jgi:hypothetical protein
MSSYAANLESSCKELRESYELYALGALEHSEKIVIDAHVASGCPNCIRGIGTAMALNAVVMSLVPLKTPRRRLRHRVLAGMGYERPRWFWVGALAAALTLALAVWLGLQERERTAQLAEARRGLMELTGEYARLNEALAFLANPATAAVRFGRPASNSPQGYVFSHPELGVLLVASNLPPAARGKSYEMWVISRDGAPHPAGLFQSDGTSTFHILKGPVDVATVASVAVTVEPATGSSAPSSKPVLVAQLGT